MKKLKVLFVALMALVTTTAWAQLTDGDYFIQNVGSGAWLGGANSWGTQASTIEHPMVFTLKVESAGVYSLHSHTYNNNDQHFSLELMLTVPRPTFILGKSTLASIPSLPQTDQPTQKQQATQYGQ